MTRRPDALLSLLHLCDSLFPIGSFAYSDGLESAAVSGLVTGVADLGEWLETCRDEGLRALGRSGDRDRVGGRRGRAIGRRLSAIDEEITALRASSTTRMANRSMGLRLLKTWQGLHPDVRLEQLLALAATPGGSDRRCPSRFRPSACCGGLTLRDALAGYAYTRLAATVSAAMRLVAIGQTDAHRLLSHALARVPSTIDGVLARQARPESFAPALDIAQMTPAIRAFAAVPIMTHQRRPVRLGIGGPVGSGKTALVDALCKRMRDDYKLGVITNDIFTREDMEFLVRSGALPADRIIGVQTGGCPHTAIREDASMNFDALDELTRRFPDLDLVFLESGGDNLAASFSPELVDASIYVIDVSGGDKIPRKGGPGVTRSDLLVINKIDLAAHVGASLDVMDARFTADARRPAVRLHQPQGPAPASKTWSPGFATSCCTKHERLRLRLQAPAVREKLDHVARV